MPTSTSERERQSDGGGRRESGAVEKRGAKEKEGRESREIRLRGRDRGRAGRLETGKVREERQRQTVSGVETGD